MSRQRRIEHDQIQLKKKTRNEGAKLATKVQNSQRRCKTRNEGAIYILWFEGSLKSQYIYWTFVASFAPWLRVFFSVEFDHVRSFSDDSFTALRRVVLLRGSRPCGNFPTGIISSASTDSSAVLPSSNANSKAHSEYQTVAFLSKASVGAQTKWATTQIEAYAIFYSRKTLHSLISDRKFTILSNHRNLHCKGDSNPVTVCWAVALSEVSFTLDFTAGKNNLIAYSMSRLCENNMLVISYSSTSFHTLMQKTDKASV